MPVAPIGNNAQHQPLTTVLRNIIREYPAGGGVLRELCQNADDAGATRVEFVLDTRSYETENILHPGLAGYQGPALLAFNDGAFSPTDFKSLSRIGDSAKATDLSATGKFGRGFNSVYNWTDMPSIISGRLLLILDPHFTWSRDVSAADPGGPLYDFVRDSSEPDMRNQLGAFGSVLKDFENEFQGTIIRLPLRTEAQAAGSKIVPDKSTSEADILEVFKKFANELVESLLFLRNVHTITLRLNEDIYAKVESTTNASHHEAKDIINKGYMEVFVKQEKDLCVTDFSTDISLYRGEALDKYKVGKKENFKYAISHYLGKGPEDKDLQMWARSQKLFPWIAIATPLEGSINFTGRLFSILPLPIHTKHPAHIHGMFSITPDRSNIHSGGDRTISENSETKFGSRWNTWLLQECLPHIWIRNLEFLSHMSESGEVKFTGWDFWPAGTQGIETDLWMGVLGTLFQQVVKQGLKLLPTVCGNTEARDDVLFTLEINEKYKNALQHARSPVSFPPADRRPELAKIGIEALNIPQLTPATARNSLSKLRNSLEELPLNIRRDLLEYVLLDKDYDSIGLCHAPLIPTSDGKFHNFSNANGLRLYFPKTKEETELFKESTILIDTGKLTPSTEKQMKSDIKKLDRYTAVSIWRVPDAVAYCKKYIFSAAGYKNGDIITRPGFSDFVNRFWKWIKLIDNMTQLSAQPQLLDELWLIPAMGDRYHRISNGRSSVLNISAKGYLSTFLRDTASSLFTRHGARYSFYVEEGFTSTTTEMICRYIQDVGDFGSVVEWLVDNRTNFVDMLNDDEKAGLISCLRDLSIGYSKNRGNGQILRKLSLFREVASAALPNPPWISLDPVRGNLAVNYIGIKYVPVALSFPNTIFIDISDSNSEELIQRLELATCPSLSNILNGYVTRNIVDSKDDTLRVAQLVEFAFGRFDLLSQESLNTLSTTKIVPVGTSTTTIQLKRPVDIVSCEFEQYFFPEENRVPTREFYDRYRLVLPTLGMAERISSEFVLERIEVYSQIGRSLEEIRKRVRKLIERSRFASQLPQKYFAFRWLPAHFSGEVDRLCSAEECRDKHFEMLVKYAMPLVEFRVPEEWRRALGWNNPLSKPQLLRQLDGAVKEKDTEAIRYLIKKGGNNLVDNCISELQEREWIPDSVGLKYYRPRDIFLEEFSPLSPYFSTVAPEFKAFEYKDFLAKLGVNKEPSFSQLKELQDKLSEKGALAKTDLEVALYIVKVVGERFAEDATLTDFKAPDDSGSLRLLRYLTAGAPDPEALDYLETNDPDQQAEKSTILHPSVSQNTIKQLRLTSFHDRFLEFLSDPDFDDDFAQKENSMTVIEDTLRRYTPSSTFNEYLANAEDCRSATEISWVLDHSECREGTRLLVEELQEVQGPALFCCNNGLFTQKDFKAVIDIGVGSKRQDYSKIGKFGRGALTMYHWTSVPSFISGDSFVIFDPELKYLPVHPITRKRRAGMKLKLQDVRLKYPDQLRPFEGIFGFDKNTSSFPGTIFRFPLTTMSTGFGPNKSNIEPEKTPRQYLKDYFESAMDSLLFLENITSISFREINTLSNITHGLTREKSSDELVWKVSSTKVVISDSPKVKELIIEGQDQTLGELKVRSHKWCVISGRKDEGDLPTPSLVEIQIKHSLEARYGLAALISETTNLDGKNYMSLPLRKPDTMEIPVHVDANLVVQSNRQSIPLEDSETEEGSEWNRWIFEQCVAQLYLSLIRHLMQTGVNGYRYWPPYPSVTTDTISRIISTAFWNRVVSSPYLLYPPESPSNRGGSPTNIRFGAAIFNLLDFPISEFVMDLLLQLGLSNIVFPPQLIRDALKALNPESMKSVSLEYLLDLFSSPRYKSKISQVWRERHGHDIQFFDTLLSFIISEATPKSLIGCELLPLVSKSLGSFRSRTAAMDNSLLVAKTPEERVILDISPNFAIHHDLASSVVEKLVSIEELNIENFQFKDIPRLHKLMGEQSIDHRKTWVTNVWSYFDHCVRESPEKQEEYLSILQDIPVYFGTPIGQPETSIQFLSPAEFTASSVPAILRQRGLTSSQESVLRCFRGLVLLDPSAFPLSQQPSELMSNVSGALGVFRLLKSIETLAKGVSIEEYVLKALQTSELETLRELLDPMMMGNLQREFSESKKYLQNLPIWPSEALAGQPPSYKPATKAVLAPDYNISFTGLTENSHFIRASVVSRYGSELNTLGVKKMLLDELLRNHVCSGQKIETNKIESYKSFLLSLHGRNPDAFLQHPLAVDEDRRYCMPSSLYDSENPIFVAAFRGMKTHFLHRDLRGLRIWQNAGLRQQITDENHYLECIRSIQRRRDESSPIEDVQLIADARTVFAYLSWDDQGMQNWDSETWNFLHTIPVAPARTEFGSSPEYKKPRMRSVLQSSNFTSLSKAVNPEFETISWSQCPTLKHKLGSFVLSQLPNNGAPSTEAVLKHLTFLSENRSNVAWQEIPAYISDVRACYEHLQREISSIPVIDTCSKAEIWLNVEAEDIRLINQDTFQKAWKCSESLCIGVKHDSPHIQFLRSFLTPFTDLLDHYRVGRHIPHIPIELPSPSIEYSAVLLSEFQRLRQEGSLLDITLDVGDTKIGAHRIILTAASKYWEKMLTGEFKEAKDNIIRLPELKAKTVRAVLGYIYTGEVSGIDASDDLSETLQDIMYQLEVANLWMLNGLKEKLEHQTSYLGLIRPETVQGILQRADESNATLLVRSCKKYIADNRDIVNRENALQ